MKTFEEWSIKNIFEKKPPQPAYPDNKIDPYGEETWKDKTEVNSTVQVDFFNEKIQANEYICIASPLLIENEKWVNEAFKIIGFTTTTKIVREDEDHVYIETYPDEFTIYWIHQLGGTPLRYNFAGPGFSYNIILDAFIPPKPYPSWILNEQTCRWIAPVECPGNPRDYMWDEVNKEWL